VAELRAWSRAGRLALGTGGLHQPVGNPPGLKTALSVAEAIFDSQSIRSTQRGIASSQEKPMEEISMEGRLEALRRSNPDARAETLRHLTYALPPEYHPWPYGMPTSAAPQVVVVGASPGNSPDLSENGAEPGRSFQPPTFGDAHPGFYYRDTKGYWEKIRFLVTSVVRHSAPALTEAEALALAGHFNLGTGRAGAATEDAVEPDIVSWVSALLGSRVPAEVVIAVGLNGILTRRSVERLWNDAPGGLAIDWRRPDRMHPFPPYQFRIWHATRSDGAPVLVCMWPNHPSRHPFAGPVGAAWRQSVLEFCSLLPQHE
jgi:hypothetical protein